MSVINKKRELFKNTGILAIGTLLSKVLTFLLLPIYTRYIESDSYGTVDLIQTIAALLIPIVTLMLTSGMFRLLIEKKSEEEKKTTISSAIFIQIILTIIFVLVSSIFVLFYDVLYVLLFIAYFISLIILTNFQFIIRGLGNNKLYSFVSFFNTAIVLFFNILFIVGLKWDGSSILLAFVVGNFLTILIILLRINILKMIRFKYYSKKELKTLLEYSIPLIPNEISWWIANTSDRLIISYFIGVGSNGIYAIANRIPVIYTTIFNVYNLAWVEAISKGINDDDSDEFIIDMFQKSIKLFGCICLGIICCTSLFFRFIIDKSYEVSYEHILILMIAIFFNSLCSLIGSILTGYKESKTIGFTTVIGAIFNFIINILFINKIGLYAASISTLVSYIVIFIIRNKKVSKHIKLRYPISCMILLGASLVVVIIGYLLKNDIINIIILIYLIVFSLCLNKQIFKDLFNRKR